MENCIFCKIVNGEIPSYKVYEDNKCVAFLDIRPYNHGHTLVIPKSHFPNFLETNDDDITYLVLVTKKLATAIEKAVNADGVQIRINIREAGGQDVFHTHVHVIPKFHTDDSSQHNISYKQNEVEEIVNKIKLNII